MRLDAARYITQMHEVDAARHLVDQALERLARTPADHPLRRLEPIKLRRLLAEAAFRELRDLKRDIGGERPQQC
jgi:hypothetical protein